MPPRPNKRAREEPLTKSETFYDEAGDLKIVSSDQVLFKVHAYRFQASSPVLRGMIELGKEDKERTIELSDPEFETADIVERILRIMFKNEKITEMTQSSHRPILRFVDKYDLQLERQIIRGEVAHMLAVPMEVEINYINIMFDLACLLHDWELCGAIVERSLRFDCDEYSDDFGEFLQGGTPLDPTTMDFYTYQQLSPGVAWALSRASLKLHDTTTKRSDGWRKKDMANEFVRLMQLKGEFHHDRLRPRWLTSLGAPRDL